MDGSQKLPQRLLGTARDRLKSGQSVGLITLGIAAWVRYVSGTDEQGESIDVRDPLARELREAVAAGAGDPQRIVDETRRSLAELALTPKEVRVLEAYLKLVDQERASWNDLSHFLAVAARAMRHILVNYAERQQAVKRGGGKEPLSLEEGNPLDPKAAEEVLEDVADNLFNPDPYYQQGGDMVRIGGLGFSCDPTATMDRRIGPIP